MMDYCLLRCFDVFTADTICQLFLTGINLTA